MELKSFIFIGRSGCGKGTQAALLSDFLKKNDPTREVFYLQVGAEFREFKKGTTHTEKLSANIYDNGGLQPEFLAVYMWARVLDRDFKGTEHLIIDGTPRKFHEAGTLHSIFDFYKRPKPVVVFIDVSKEWATERLIERGRVDDTKSDIESRLAWFDVHVVPALGFYRGNTAYDFIEVNGERSTLDIHVDIAKRAHLI